MSKNYEDDEIKKILDSHVCDMFCKNEKKEMISNAHRRNTESFCDSYLYYKCGKRINDKILDRIHNYYC